MNIASKDPGLFFNSFSKIVVFKLKEPSLSVLIPRFDKYLLVVPNPANASEDKVFNRSFTFLLLDHQIILLHLSVLDPLNVFSFNNFLAVLTASTKDCKLEVAETVSTDPTNLLEYQYHLLL